MNRRRFLKDSAFYSGLIGPLGRIGSSDLHAQSTGPLANPGAIDLRDAVVVAPETLSRRERKAAQVLVEEVEKRTEFRWPMVERLPAGARPALIVVSDQALKQARLELPDGLVSEDIDLARPEGYRLRATSSAGSTVILVFGAGERGVLFGVGGLLRNLRMDKNQAWVSGSLNVTTAPKYRLRGHQLGYRPKTNSYDGWTVEMWEQYIRDLAVFGANAIELIPPRSDDEPDSPNFPLPPKQMMVEMSRICDDYGLDVWIWYPAMDKDYSDPKTVEFALNEWGEIFKTLPRIDNVFVPGGNPGHTPPKYLMTLVAKQARNLRQYHPHARMWVSPQDFNREQMEEFFDILNRDRPQWLAGVVFASEIRIPLSEVRARLPQQYPIRLYPDITHSLECTFPVPYWDTAYAYTEGREVINPRPEGYANIMRMYLPYTIGFISYSEGCNDDVNKIVCSQLAWNPEAKVINILREYSRYFIGDQFTEGFAQGLLALEQNWRGPLISHPGVMIVLRQFQAMEDAAFPHDLLKWRLLQGLFRAYYDAYVRSRLLWETALEQQAMARLEEVRQFGVRPAPLEIGATQDFSTNQLDLRAVLDEAESLLNETFSEPVAQGWRARILELGGALYQSSRMQMAFEYYKAEAVVRGGTLDTLDAPITNLPWVQHEIRRIRSLSSRNDQVNAVLELLNRNNPGPGGFYDDLGNVAAHQPHLTRGLGSAKDPEFRVSPNYGFSYPEEDVAGNYVPVAWKNWAESRYDAPLEMYYPNLDPAAQYRIRVVYAGDGDSIKKKIRLVADQGIEVHGYIQKSWPVRPLEFDVPREATSGGNLRVRWYGEPGLGGNGRGCQVAEVWLMRSR